MSKKGIKISYCLSTHGGAGYSGGDFLTIYRKQSEPTIDVRATFKCGGCGYEGDARPTGSKQHPYLFKENPIKWLIGRVKYTEPTWPEFLNRRYVYF